ncbi:hypothetical protein [Kitasatospora sp. NPDC051914]|uniref:hypothetical protein n=1 Tax=Kitasatospora sp. NPDC051914 TaxID=3154945 RepID=UPI00344726D3
MLTDAYSSLGLYLGYDDDDLLSTIEAASPALVSLSGVRLLDRNCSDVLAELRAAGLSPRETSSGWAIPEMGLVFGTPPHGDAGGFQSIFISRGTDVVHEFEFFGAEGQLPGGGFELMPHKGFGDVRLGARRVDMRQLLGEGVASLSESGADYQDTFFSAGVVLNYDAQELVTRAIVMRPAQAFYRGIELLGRPCRYIREQALSSGFRVVTREAELFFPEGGFSLWTSRAGDDALPTVAAVVSVAGPKSLIT